MQRLLRHLHELTGEKGKKQNLRERSSCDAGMVESSDLPGWLGISTPRTVVYSHLVLALRGLEFHELALFGFWPPQRRDDIGHTAPLRWLLEGGVTVEAVSRKFSRQLGYEVLYFWMRIWVLITASMISPWSAGTSQMFNGSVTSLDSGTNFHQMFICAIF